MLKFFRKIRRQLLSDHKIGKYLKYAFGEIILVVLGILIALQINTWNTNYQLIKKEKRYLREIKENLLIDKEEAKNDINFNNHKLVVIDSLMRLISIAKSSDDYMNYLAINQPVLSSFPTFEPVSIAFDNMISSHSIDIIHNSDLRIKLSKYYNYNWERSPQSASRSRTRKFADLIMEKLVDYPVYQDNVQDQLSDMLNANNQLKWNGNFKLEINDPNYLEFHNDRDALASMFIMLPTSVYQSKWIEDALYDIEILLEIIEVELETE